MSKIRTDKKKLIKYAFFLWLISIFILTLKADAVNIFPFGEIGWEGTPEDVSTSIQILLVLTILSIAPSILLMMTCFTRIIIVLSFIRNALGLQQTPPNQVLIGIALFLTFFVMSPVINNIKVTAYEPYMENEIGFEQALELGEKPIRDFMLKQVHTKDLNLFLNLANKELPETYDEIPMNIVVPSFIISELKRAFQIGFLILIPFIIIDMVVSSTLMSMGMLMLPPVMISLPFKIMLFVLVDGWNLVIKTLVTSFN